MTPARSAAFAAALVAFLLGAHRPAEAWQTVLTDGPDNLEFVTAVAIDPFWLT